MPEDLNAEEVLQEAEMILSSDQGIPPAIAGMIEDLERLVEESRTAYDMLSEIEVGVIERLRLLVESETRLITDTMASIKNLFDLP